MGIAWQSQWDCLYEQWFRGDEFRLALFGTYIVSWLAVFGGNVGFLVLDITGRPSRLLHYRIQGDTQLDAPKFWKAIRLVTVNKTCVELPFMCALYHAMRWRGCALSGALPTPSQVLRDLLGSVILLEIFFYYSHRLLHHPRLYKHVHKIHHEWTAPISIVSLYAHPVEYVVGNLGPVVIGPLCMGSHLLTFWLWITVAILSTAVTHSGYHFPLLSSPEAHDYHHLKFNENYGSFGWMDRLHGTDIHFRKSIQFLRHKRFWTLDPPKQQIPDYHKQKAT